MSKHRTMQAVAVALTCATAGCALTPIATLAPAVLTPPAARPIPARAPAGELAAHVAVFCGPDPLHPSWRSQMASLATIGVTDVYGPCRTPPPGYTVLEPGGRYATPGEYLELAAYAATLGLGVIVYDARLWSPDPVVQAQAADDWAPYSHMVGVDLGDEPVYADMSTMDARTAQVRALLPGVPVHTFFVSDGVWGQGLVESHRAMPTDCPGSDNYINLVQALGDAQLLADVAGCANVAVDVTGRNLDGDADRLNVGLLAEALERGHHVTLFGGLAPDNFPTWAVVVDGDGHITPDGHTVREALS